MPENNFFDRLADAHPDLSARTASDFPRGISKRTPFSFNPSKLPGPPLSPEQKEEMKRKDQEQKRKFREQREQENERKRREWREKKEREQNQPKTNRRDPGVRTRNQRGNKDRALQNRKNEREEREKAEREEREKAERKKKIKDRGKKGAGLTIVAVMAHFARAYLRMSKYQDSTSYSQWALVESSVFVEASGKVMSKKAKTTEARWSLAKKLNAEAKKASGHHMKLYKAKMKEDAAALTKLKKEREEAASKKKKRRVKKLDRRIKSSKESMVSSAVVAKNPVKHGMYHPYKSVKAMATWLTVADKVL